MYTLNDVIPVASYQQTSEPHHPCDRPQSDSSQTQIGIQAVQSSKTFSRLFDMCRLVTVLALLLKLHLARAAVKHFSRGQRVWRGLCRNLTWFWPTMFLPEGDDHELSKHIGGRVVVLCWIHLIAGVVLLVVSIVVALFFDYVAEFRSMYQNAAMLDLMYAKAASIALVFLALWRRMDLTACMSQCFCLDCYEYYAGGSKHARKQRRRRRRRGHLPVPIDHIMLRDIVSAKGIDQVRLCTHKSQTQ